MTGKVTVATGANPGAPGAGLASLYVNASEQPCKVGADGLERPLVISGSSGGSPVIELVSARKPSNQSVASNTTLQNDADLLFGIDANEEWLVDLYIDVGAVLSTTGLKIAATVPAGGTFFALRAALTPDVFGNANIGALRTNTSGAALDFTAAGEVGVSNASLRCAMEILNGGNAGTVQLQFCQSSNSATNVTLRRGSHLVGFRIA